MNQDYEISYDTIRRRLNENGFFNYIPARQTLLKAHHLANRIRFCEENYGRDWDKVIFSDEKTFKSINDRASSLWRPHGDRYDPKYVQTVTLSGRITCGVWGYITAGGPGEITPTSSRMNSDEYLSILGEILLPSMISMYGESANEFIFMQDNASIHTSAVARSWFQSHPEVIQLRWPPCSPDLNPIENVWSNMVYNWPQQGFRNRNEIIDTINMKWDDLRGTDYIPKLYNSMPTRMREVIHNNGNWCSY